jgi:trans-2,3-dihydro-3-hydroxyanthranilate isomerase
MRRRFHTLDVFTDRKLAGNPLAVVHDSEGLDTATMQAIAREFNLSETVFVLRPDDPVNTARIRIFTPAVELPFAGHPTVGTGILLAQLRAPEMVNQTGVVIALEQPIGLVSVEVSKSPGKTARGIFSLPKLPIALEGVRDAGLIAAALGLEIDDIGIDGHHPADFSAGVPFTCVPLRSLEAMARAKAVTGAAFESAFGGTPRPTAYLYAKEAPERWRARMFAPGFGLGEDPATGAAAAAFAGALMAYEQPLHGERQHIITQGVEMGRPSEIVLTLEVESGHLYAATIGGNAVMVSEGLIDI